jgi:hypothetical protein
MTTLTGSNGAANAHYSQKYLDDIKLQLTRVMNGWNSKAFIDYFCEKEIAPVLHKLIAETNSFNKKETE